MKKTIIYALVAVGVAAGVFFFGLQTKTVEYIKQVETKEVEKKVEVDVLDARIKDAIASSSQEIETRAQKAYNDAKRQAEVEIELDVTAKYREELEARELELQKEASFQ